MAAYAALVSLTHVIDQLQHHPRPPISLNKQQVESLAENIAFLQEFLEIHNGGDGGRRFESRIADTAYAAEDIIELHIVDESQTLDGSTSWGHKIGAPDLYEGLQRINERMDSIKKEAKEVEQKPAQRNLKSLRSLRQQSTRQQSTTMVGMDDVLYEMMDMLVRGSSNRRVIPITGMGGIGKTTLARNLYQNQTVVQHFHFLAWSAISQEYTMKEILLQLLQQLLHGKEMREKLRHMNEYDLGEKLHKELWGRRYLIIIDDIWDIKIWEKLKLYFPNYENGSRIVLTTRLSSLASLVADSHCIEMGFLNEDQSWNLFCNIVFGKEDCPFELEKPGRKIVESCRGLPLSINVIGGHLAMSLQTQQHWEYIAENVSSVVNLEGNEHCLKILYTSYNNLPLYLKPCFLYMSGFREDSKINVSNLIRLWVAEGFLKPSRGKTLEEVAEECVTELVERNLILVERRNYYGKVKSFRIHDLLRDLWIREARKEKFLYLPGLHSLDASQERRVWTNERTKLEGESAHVLGSLSVARSLMWKHEKPQLPRFGARLLRLYTADYSLHLADIFKRVNLRYIDTRIGVSTDDLSPQIPSSISVLWNLQTLVLVLPPRSNGAPFEIWELPQLRHVKVRNVAIEPPDHEDGFVLENLHTLLEVQNLSLREEIVMRIPNISKLGLLYQNVEAMRSDDLNLYYIGHLSKLNSLTIDNMSRLVPEMRNLIFPNSLKKLTLYGTDLPWEVMTTMVGSLPLLEGLRLRRHACVGLEWITIKDHFRSLKLLEISWCPDLKYWETESSHFPRLEHVILEGVHLKEIPSTLGDISTLQSIRLSYCLRSAYNSAKRIQEEQEELENLDLQFHFSKAEFLDD